MWWIAIIGFALGTVAFHKTERGRRTQEWFKYKYGKWLDLLHMVRTRHSGSMVYLISIKMLSQAAYADFLSVFDNRIRKIGKRSYEIQYYIEGKLYRLPVKVDRGPSKILTAVNNKEECVFLQIEEYISPDGSLNNMLVTPKFLGHESITISTFADDKTFLENEPILIE